ncbi:hypothetical protein FOL47_001213 [Perkinsus chesapeaki]|uniref:Uncharacterized protein n=1 Tax=Perkinsus chesapeaki TaxID=330153 RepID=A0A7J6MK15_PERCH|nr:hypothetical protein FOL47_001213 [Perkinsus chesapeaki]
MARMKQSLLRGIEGPQETPLAQDPKPGGPLELIDTSLNKVLELAFHYGNEWYCVQPLVVTPCRHFVRSEGSEFDRPMEDSGAYAPPDGTCRWNVRTKKLDFCKCPNGTTPYCPDYWGSERPKHCVCTTECAWGDDCPRQPSGNSPPYCHDRKCLLGCRGPGRKCPEDMSCIWNFFDKWTEDCIWPNVDEDLS